MRCSTPDEPKNRADNADPKKEGNSADGADAAIQEHDEDDYQGSRNCLLSVLAERIKVGSVLREANGAGRETERRLNKRLPDKEERHETAHAARAIGFAEKHVAPASKGHSRAQFRPDEPIEQSEHGTRRPSQQTLRA